MTYSPVYSLRILAAGNVTAATGEVGPVVPDGLVYVVRDIDLINDTGAPGDEIYLKGQALQLLWVVKQPSPATTVNFAWRGRQVYNAGERVGFVVVAGTWDISVSGYQLTLP